VLLFGVKRKIRDSAAVPCPRVEFLLLKRFHRKCRPQVAARSGHFMPAALLSVAIRDLGTLMSTASVTVDVGHSVDAIIDIFLAG